MSKKKHTEPNTIFRSTKLSMKYMNVGKRDKILAFLSEYSRVMGIFVDVYWTMDAKDIKTFPSKGFVDVITDSWLSARAILAAAKQSGGIVKGAKTKDANRIAQIKILNDRGMFKQARKLQAIHDIKMTAKPILKDVPAELDMRFFALDMDNDTTFDGWINLGSLGFEYGSKIRIPFKHTSHFNELLGRGVLRNWVRISKEYMTFTIGIEKQENTNTDVMGIDIGVTTLFSMYDGKEFSATGKDIHGHDMDSILTKMSRKKKGSKGFKKAQQHRKNYINRCVKQIPWDGLKEIKYERIRGLRRGASTKRKLTHFAYREVFDRIDLTAEEMNVSILEVNPTYTSQRCSCCGWTQKKNRSGKVFKCKSCGYTTDADLNASRNIFLHLPWISKADRLKQPNRTGFYWYAEGQEHIVPVGPKISLD